MKTCHNTKPPSPIIRNNKNQICHPLFTKKTLQLISIPMKTISSTYQCGHIKKTTYPPYQKQLPSKSTNTKGSSRRHFSYFKCIKQKQQTITNQRTELCKGKVEDKINITQWKRNP